MRQYTLVFDGDLTTEDLALYEHCAGVLGVSSFGNVMNLYYAQPLGAHEVHTLAATVDAHTQTGITLVANGDDTITSVQELLHI